MYAVAAILFTLARLAPALAAAEPLVGVVVDTDGKPVAGVDILLSIGTPPAGEQPLIGGLIWMPRAAASPAAENPVLGRSRTDRDGHFRIDLPAEIVRSQEPLPVALWAYKAGGRVASRRLPWAIPAPTDPIRLTIEKAGAANFRLIGSDNAPDGGARVEVTALDGLAVPGELAEKSASVTGPDGTVTISAFAPGEIRWVRIESRKFGTQVLRGLGLSTADPSVLRLEPVGRVSGRVAADAGKPVSGLRIRAHTFPDGYDLGGTVGTADAVTDASGRFEIPAIAAGRLAITCDLRSRPDLSYRGLPPASQVVDAGTTTAIEIRLKRAVRLEGMVRERASGLPIAGVSPEIPDPAIRMGGTAAVVTDALGRFEGYMERDQPYAFLCTAPKPYFIPPDSPDTLHLLPPGATDFKLPPIELVRGAALRGAVVDEFGKLVPGALVRATWGGKGTVLQSVAARTYSNGTFLLEGLDPLADLHLTAQAEGRSTVSPQIARAGADKPVKLVVSQAAAVALAGRVVDSSGKPIAGAHVRIRSQTRIPTGEVWRIDPVVEGVGDALRTDAGGRFRTPHGVPSSLEYEAVAITRGMRPGRTAWIKPTGGATAEFPAIMLSRLRSVVGVVRDRQGRVIEGVTVSQSGDGPIRTRAVSDSQGRFQIGGIIEGKTILFARKDGFRFQGQPINTESGPAELVISRSDESPGALKTLDSVLPRDEEVALANRLLAPYVEKCMAQGTDVQKLQTLRELAPIDPAQTLELIEAKGAGKPRFAIDMLRSIVASSLSARSPDEAVSIAESIEDPTDRSWCLTDVLDKLPVTARTRKVELLAQAQLQAKGVKQPAQKIRLLGRIAERWLDLGETDRANALLGEGRLLAKDVPPPAYEVTTFAQALARTDLRGALDLIDKTKDSAKRGDRVNRAFVFDRCYGEIAYRLGSDDPPAAERVLAMIVDPYRRGGYLAAACLRMAARDLPRARRLAETIDDPLIRAYALGLMARALANEDNAASLALLDLAFDQVEQFQDDRQTYSSPACVAAVLLEAAEKVAPARLQEYVWRAVSLRKPLLDERGEGSGGRFDANLALSLARYDRTAAAAVLARALASFNVSDADTLRQAFLTMALALIDPARAGSLVEAMPDDPGLERTLPKNAARLYTSEILGKHGNTRWQTTRQWGISLWKPEGSDL